MNSRLSLIKGRIVLLAAAFAVIAGLCPVAAGEKPGMPDICQIEQTCLPTSTANLVVWFAKNGYPKLLMSGATKDEQYQHTVHQIMRVTEARYDLGTKMDTITSGIKKYIEDAGYNCDVEYRGLHEGAQTFSMDWLKENDDPNKGFILLLSYVAYNETNNTYMYAYGAGHAVTLVNIGPNMLLIHDPAHEEDETGRKLLTPEVLTGGMLLMRDRNVSTAGLAMLSGSLLDSPPGSSVMLTGAVCITMHPDKKPDGKPAPDVQSGSIVAGTPPAAGTTGAAKPTPATTSWFMWFFDLFFSK